MPDIETRQLIHTGDLDFPLFYIEKPAGRAVDLLVGRGPADGPDADTVLGGQVGDTGPVGV
jgi:hypothetical protein